MKSMTLENTLTAIRILLGVFFVLSGIANYLHFNDPGGLMETLLGQKLKLWGLGFAGIGPLPPLLALPYAYLLPAVEIGAGLLFALNRWTTYAGTLMILMLVSFILAFGLFPAGGLFPNNESTWDKNVFIALLVWVCVAWEARRRPEASAERRTPVVEPAP